jgi:hypothetical protein
MHYKNGREAKNGDRVAHIRPTGFGADGKPNSFVVTTGILYDAVAGNDFCNGRLAEMRSTDGCPNLKECLHLEDLLAAGNKEG